ncbi:MAG: tRNA (adenosine(37)-N6)-threonylcarbamoyltransferase complex ATPase subunit type 1 TsaE [Bacteroidia bacterium]
MKSITYIIKCKEDWEMLAQYILKNYPDKKIFLLYGNLGAGKTTLVQAFGKILNVTEHITSPTFSIMHEYHFQNKQKIYHFDLYRLKSVEELKAIGFEDILYNDYYLCFIEWPDIAEKIIKESELKDKTIQLKINLHHECNSREVNILLDT